MTLDISDFQERKRIKRKLLGLCGTETVKDIRDIALAMMPKNYQGYVFEMEDQARKIISLERMHYHGSKFLFFDRIVDDNPTERYRIRLVNADTIYGEPNY